MYIQLLIPIKYCHAACTFWFSFFLYTLFLTPCESHYKWHYYLPEAQHPCQHLLNHHSIIISFCIFQEFIQTAFLHGRKMLLSPEGAAPCKVQCQFTSEAVHGKLSGLQQHGAPWNLLHIPSQAVRSTDACTADVIFKLIEVLEWIS